MLMLLSGGVSGGGGGGTTPPAGAFTVSVSPTSVEKFRTGAGYVTTGQVLAVASGGTGPYTYAWTLSEDFNNGGSIDILDPADDDTTFRAYVPNGDFCSGIFRVAATDSVAAIGYGYVSIVLRSTSDGSDGQIQ